MTDNDAAYFLDLLSSMGLRQHIDFPIHTSGNTLDLLISRTLSSNIYKMSDLVPISLTTF